MKEGTIPNKLNYLKLIKRQPQKKLSWRLFIG